jgi:hypothetical protein
MLPRAFFKDTHITGWRLSLGIKVSLRLRAKACKHAAHGSRMSGIEQEFGNGWDRDFHLQQQLELRIHSTVRITNKHSIIISKCLLCLGVRCGV